MLLFAEPARGYADGIVADHCVHCHEAPLAAEVILAGPGDDLTPGELALFEVELQAEGTVVGGVSIQFEGPGELVALDGRALKLLGGRLTHAEPIAAVDGRVSFEFGYLTPAEPGNVVFTVTALAADGDGSALGDVSGEGFYGFAFGCDSLPFYEDWDADGYGDSDAAAITACVGSPPEGYTSQGGDCDDFDPKVSPSALEVCNQKDDDCNGAIDDERENQPLCVDGKVCREGQCSTPAPAQADCAVGSTSSPARSPLVVALVMLGLLGLRRGGK